MSSRRVGYAFFWLFAAALATYQYIGFSSAHTLFADFRAFWCAGSVLAAHGNPYHAAPMSACEQTPVPALFYRPPANIALPAPLPGYVLAFFVPLAALPYSYASIVWLAFIALAAALSAVLLALVVRANVLTCAYALLLPAVLVWFPFGELTSVALCGALLAAWALQRERFGFAAAGLAIAAVLPQLAVGMWIACGLLVPRARVPLVIAGCVLCLLWAVTGTGLAVEYLRGVLPVHALAELPRPAQYSLSWVLHALGVSNAYALRAGAISSIVMLAIGIAIAALLMRKWNDRAVAVLVPLAAATLGGTFMHAGNLLAAMPLALLLAARTCGSWRMVACVSIVLLALPWSTLGSEPAAAVSAVIVAGVLAYTFSGRTIWGYRAALFAVLTIAVLTYAARHDIMLFSNGAVPQSLADNRVDASASWGRYIWSVQSGLSLGTVLAKALLWAGAMLSLVCAGGVALTNKKLVPAVRVEHAPTAL